MSERLALIVEDSEDLALVLRSMLRTAGYEVEAVATLADARATLERAAVALLVTDMRLPDGDGLELVAALRDDAAFATLPVVVATAATLGDEESARVKDGLRAGLIRKPFTAAQLRHAVEQARAALS